MTLLPKALVVSCLLLAPLAFAADADRPQERATPAENSAPGIDLQKIIVAVSQKTHKRFLMDPRVQAKVNLVGFDEHDVTYPLLLSILTVYGFTASSQDGVVVIAPDASARQAASPVVAGDNVPGSDSEWVTTIVSVKNVSAPQLVPILRPLLPQNAHLAALPERNALIVVDHAANVRRLVAVINALDKLPARKSE